MRKWLHLSLGIVLSSALTASATDFRLEPRELSIKDALAFPGQMGGLTHTRPGFCRNEPPAKSRRPFYGFIRTDGNVRTLRAEWPTAADPHIRIFRLDESKGDRSGYDQLILDLNHNNDLTDDPVASPNENAAHYQPSLSETVIFGPIAAGPSQTIGPWHPAYYAELHLLNLPMLPRVNSRSPTGYLLVRPANYLQATVELDGIKQLMAIIDANCNGQLGDRPRHVKSAAAANSPILQGGDRLLRDMNGSGRFDITRDDESEWFGNLVFFGVHPYAVALAKNLESMRIEPYSGPTGELVIQPLPAHVRRITLFRDSGGTEVEPVTVRGPAQLPAGIYELCGCLVEGKSGTNKTITSEGLWRNHPTALKVEANTAAVLKCGPPFMITPLASVEQTEVTRTGLMAAAASLFGGGTRTEGSVMINLGEIAGAGGEIYSEFKKNESSRVPSPRFIITDNAGKEVASGKLEYG